jgi:hypothetical protein
MKNTTTMKSCHKMKLKESLKMNGMIETILFELILSFIKIVFLWVLTLKIAEHVVHFENKIVWNSLFSSDHTNKLNLTFLFFSSVFTRIRFFVKRVFSKHQIYKISHYFSTCCFELLSEYHFHLIQIPKTFKDICKILGKVRWVYWTSQVHTITHSQRLCFLIVIFQEELILYLRNNYSLFEKIIWFLRVFILSIFFFNEDSYFCSIVAIVVVWWIVNKDFQRSTQIFQTLGQVLKRFHDLIHSFNQSFWILILMKTTEKSTIFCFECDFVYLLFEEKWIEEHTEWWIDITRR